ncbi:ABC transporter substrate-binding protein [Rhodovarius crocodyli]|uniref:ABC transporter substrate-binding protein n=1 Tax=Rhodovarius crocodyli TaxID=1979269 RepID=A0A437M3E6_9PROT|nr:ABC transporter substrate-binding protein [Rhodovarius crocodyli]RVT92218.1 ABC transporter substrate-binding protein [Rhodovarius crocodyli]
MRLTAIALGCCLSIPAWAQTLTLGVSATPNSVDPHFNYGTSTQTLTYHLFDTLFQRQPDSTLAPGLALSWHAVEPTVWEIKLRPDVRFTNGAAFTADDVVFSIARAPNVPNATASYAGAVRSVDRVEVIDPLTIRIHTRGPAPTMPMDMAPLGIVSRQVGEGAATEDYNAGRAAIGTGPYRLIRFIPGQQAELERNPNWWGPAQPWERVVLRFLPNAGTRTAALLSGDVDLIDTPSPNDLPRLRGDNRFAVFSGASMRLVYLAPNQQAQVAPFITDNAGNPLPANPLRDQRVRQALSMAINREALATRIMQGTASPAGQWMPAGTYSHNPAVPVPAQDIEGARRLLAAAGYPDGFRMTMHVPNNARPTDPISAQAIAQMWTRVGVRTEVEAQPLAAYSPRAARMEYAMTMHGWGSIGHSGHPMVNMVATNDRQRLTGGFNRSGYSNPAIDEMIATAMAEMDDAKREQLLNQAVAASIQDGAVIPLYNLTNFWAARRGVEYRPTTYDYTLAINARPVR